MDSMAITALATDKQILVLGEPITLPTGEARAIVDLPVSASESRLRGSDAGARLTFEHQVRAVIHLRTADAAGLKERDPVIVRGAEYLVVDMSPDGAGMTLVDLMLPGDELGQSPDLNRWR